MSLRIITLFILMLLLNACTITVEPTDNSNDIPDDTITTFTSKANGIYTNVPLSKSFLAQLAGLKIDNVETRGDLIFDINFAQRIVTMNMSDTVLVVDDADLNGTKLPFLNIINAQLTYDAGTKMIKGDNVSNEGGSHKFDDIDDRIPAIDFGVATGSVEAIFNDTTQQYDGGFTLIGEKYESHVVVFGDRELIPSPDFTATFTYMGADGFYTNAPVATALGLDTRHFATKSDITLKVNFTRLATTMNMGNTVASLANNNSNNGTELPFLNISDAPLRYNITSKVISGDVTNAGGAFTFGDYSENIATATGKVNATLNDDETQIDGGFTLLGDDNYRHIVAFGANQAILPDDVTASFTGKAAGTYTNDGLATALGDGITSLSTQSDLTLDVNFTSKEVSMNMQNTKTTIGNDATALDFLNIANASLTYDTSDKMMSGTVTNTGGTFTYTQNNITIIAGTGDVTATLNQAEDALLTGNNFTLTSAYGDAHQVAFFDDTAITPVTPVAITDRTAKFIGKAAGTYTNDGLATALGDGVNSLPTQSLLTLDVNFTNKEVSMDMMDTKTIIDNADTALDFLNITNASLTYDASDKTIAGTATNTGGTFTYTEKNIIITAGTGAVSATLNDAETELINGSFTLASSDGDSHDVNFFDDTAVTSVTPNTPVIPDDTEATFTATALGNYQHPDLASYVSNIPTTSGLTLDVDFTSKEVIMNLKNTEAYNLKGSFGSFNGEHLTFLDIENASLTYDENSRKITGNVTNKGDKKFNTPLGDFDISPSSGDVTATLNQAGDAFTGNVKLTGDGTHIIDAFTAIKK